MEEVWKTRKGFKGQVWQVKERIRGQERQSKDIDIGGIKKYVNCRGLISPETVRKNGSTRRAIVMGWGLHYVR